MLEVEYRQCTVCKESKLLFEFCGKWKVCKGCDKVRRRQRSKDCKDFVFNYLLSHPCRHCPETEPVVLTFHHLHDKKDTISHMIRKGIAIKKVIEEIDKCIVLCHNCHARLHAKEGGWLKG
jgi:hypothetical protein